jgi:hypothetical protein
MKGSMEKGESLRLRLQSMACQETPGGQLELPAAELTS